MSFAHNFRLWVRLYKIHGVRVWKRYYHVPSYLRSFVRNKFACIKKLRPDGTMKYRIIMDSKESGVTSASRKQYKQILPRQTDLISDALSLMADMQAGEQIDFFVCDAEDAYWQVPLHPEERRYYCAILRLPNGRTVFVVHVRTAQGSRGAPLSWAVVFGLVCRCVLAVLRRVIVRRASRLSALTSPTKQKKSNGGN